MLKKFLKRSYATALHKLPDFYSIQLRYLKWFHRLPNLKNPKTFNEKIAWRKLYQRDPRFSIFSDKIAVKVEIAKLIGKQYLIETLWTGDRPEDIPYDTLKPPYVIKTSHGSGGNIFIRASQDIDPDRISKTIYNQLNYNHADRYREWGYSAIPRKIIVERLIVLPNGEFPEDYKFFVYSGRVHFVHVDLDRFKGHKRNLYDRDWNRLPCEFGKPSGRAIPKPETFEQMIKIAETIGGQFDFARVDLYSTPQGVLFGEVTFYPAGGIELFNPPEWDLKFGNPWKISKERT